MIFLLGGKGFIGSAFCRVLQERGLSFQIITRDNYAQFIGRRCEIFINANGNSSKVLARKDPKWDFQASVETVRNTLEDFRFDTYLYLSSGDVYPDCSSPELTLEEGVIDARNQSPYGFHKALAEQCVAYAADKWLVVRQGGFVGPGLKKNAVFDVLHGDKIWVHPDSRFQFIHTDDSAEACLDLISTGATNDIFNLTATGTLSVSEIMNMAGKHLPSPDDAIAATYEMSTEKVARRVKLPATAACIQKFLAAERG